MQRTFSTLWIVVSPKGMQHISLSDIDGTLCSRRFKSYYEAARDEYPVAEAVAAVERDGCRCCARRGAGFLDAITQLGRLVSV